MRRPMGTNVAFVLVVSLAAMAGCADDGWSPSDPRDFSSRMFEDRALEPYSMAEQAWIKGHAIGIYLVGKNLPEFVADRGYVYRPGVSAPHGRVPYTWHAIVKSPAGGTDGNGTGVMYDDVPQPPDGVCDETEYKDPDCACADEDDVTTEGCIPPADPLPPQDPPPTPPGGDGDCDEDDVGDPDCGGEIHPDCETFLDPAAVKARYQALDVDALKVLGGNFRGDDEDFYVEQFYRGLEEALRVQDFGENVHSSEIEYLKEYVQYYGLCEYSPLVVDLDGDGIEASSVRGGVAFDLLETGRPVRTAWPSGDDALLVLDRNGDGAIGNAGELFGTSFRDGSSGDRHANGFVSLAQLDRVEAGGNGDGVLDIHDARYAALQLWRDDNRDGVSQPGELVSLRAAGIVAIRLTYVESDARDRHGNALRQHGTFVRTGGGEGVIIDVWFRYSTR